MKRSQFICNVESLYIYFLRNFWPHLHSSKQQEKHPVFLIIVLKALIQHYSTMHLVFLLNCWSACKKHWWTINDFMYRLLYFCHQAPHGHQQKHLRSFHFTCASVLLLTHREGKPCRSQREIRKVSDWTFIGTIVWIFGEVDLSDC